MFAEEYFLAQKDNHQEILLELRKIILDASPDIIEKLSYGVPFYYYFGPMIYLSVRKGMVNISFTHGFEMSDPFGILVAEDRKMIRSLIFSNVTDINVKQLNVLIYEAMAIKEMYNNKKKKV